ncbi:MAG: hypothetical protein DRN92_06430 [Thermoproteota archaeon]|nr:MAG: hypothetical protein DRN92_06430 [Candidatus Korarchaeota archaeon]
MSLNGKTPAEESGIDLNLGNKNDWICSRELEFHKNKLMVGIIKQIHSKRRNMGNKVRNEQAWTLCGASHLALWIT